MLLEDRNGFVHPSVNANGGETIGYQLQDDRRGRVRIVNGVVASLVVVDWTNSYSAAVRELRKRERAAWEPKRKARKGNR